LAEYHRLSLFSVVLILLGLFYFGCKPPPPTVAVKPQYYSPVEIEPLFLKSRLAIPTIENGLIDELDNTRILPVLSNLTDKINKIFIENGRFEIVSRDEIVNYENQKIEDKLPLINYLENADLILYMMIIDWDKVSSNLTLGVYLVIREKGQVLERFKVKFDYKTVDNSLIFNEDQIFKFSLKVSRNYPRLKCKVISREGKTLCIGMQNKDKTFLGQEAIVYNSYSKIDPKYKSREHSFIAVSEIRISGSKDECLLGEVIRGDEKEIEPGDYLIMK